MRSESNRSGSLYYVIVIVILGFFLLGLNQSHNEGNTVKKPVPYSISVAGYNALPGPVIKVQFLQKNWIVNKDSFKLLAFNRNPLFTSKRAELIISYFSKERLSFLKRPPAILIYHLFQSETDDHLC
jgi:hypothetical protein